MFCFTRISGTPPEHIISILSYFPWHARGTHLLFPYSFFYSLLLELVFLILYRFQTLLFFFLLLLNSLEFLLPPNPYFLVQFRHVYIPQEVSLQMTYLVVNYLIIIIFK